MRDWPGIDPAIELDPIRRDKDAKIDFFLRMLSQGMARIQQGQLPDGSGTPIGDVGGLFWLLAGRPDNQLGYGGTSPGGTATIASTAHETKGFTYLGGSEIVAVDETNAFVGIGRSNPAARLHIEVDYALTSLGNPSSSSHTGGNWNPNGAATLHGACSDQDDATFARWTEGLGNDSMTLNLDNLTQPITDPGVNTGFIVYVTMRASANHNSQMEIGFDHADGSPILLSTRTFHGPAGGAGTAITSSFVQYPIALTDAECALVDFSKQWRISAVNNGTPAVGATFDISEAAAEIPSGGTDAASVLQKWTDGLNDNTLQYANDSLNVDTLQLIGTTFRFATTGLQFDIGTPTAGYVWSAQDTEGTGAWVTLGSLLDDDLDAIAALSDLETGFLVKTAANTWALRDLTVGSGLSVSNPAGVAGDPQITLDADLVEIAALANTAGHLLYTNATDNWALLTGPSAANQVLRSSAANTFAWGALVAADLPTHDHSSASEGGVTLRPLTLIARNGQMSFQNNLGLGVAKLIDGSNRAADDEFYFPPAGNSSVLAGLSVAETWLALQTFSDATIKIVDDVTASKTLVFQLGSSTANADLTLDYRSAVDRSLIWNLSGGTGGNLQHNWAGTATSTVTWPTDTAYTLAARNLVQTFTRAQTFEPSVDEVAFKMVANTGFTNNTMELRDETTALYWKMSGAGATFTSSFMRLAETGANIDGAHQAVVMAVAALAADRTVTWPDLAGVICIGPAFGTFTSGRVVFATTGGRLTDDADFTFATDTLTVTKIAATTFTGNLTISTKDIVTDTTTGTKIGTAGGASGQKLGFFNATPIVQPLLATGAGATVDNVITALQNLGLVRQS